MPNLEIEDDGAVRLELWCKGGQGRFSVAGSTVVFVPGTMEERSCPADRADLDDDLVQARPTARGFDFLSDLQAMFLPDNAQRD